ncbi:nuclear transport factor 2 family protein [Parafrankia sp. FMc2]|uniref:nuclear transport factor 2 family protein n=1 Tax=Parafrankia sp. FMc2 TaxID=3233196 RepID=UPI0034D4EB98
MARWRMWLTAGLAGPALLFTGCSDGGATAPAALADATAASAGSADDSGTGARERRTAAATRGFLDAFERRDLDTITNLLTDQVTLVQPMSFTGAPEPAIRFSGRDEVIGYFRQVFAAMGRISFVDERITVGAGGDTVFVQANGDFTGADGGPYRNVYLFRFDWRDGRLVSGEEYANPIIFARRFNFPIG